MPIPIVCPKCSKKYQAKDEHAGKAMKCSCGETIAIKQPVSTPAPAAKGTAAPLSSSLFDGLDIGTSASAPNAAKKAEPMSPLSYAPPQKRSSKNVRKDNMLGNFRRWKKGLIALAICWLVLILAVFIIAPTYAYQNNFGPERTQLLGQACGTALAVLLVANWLPIIFIAANKKPK